MFSYRTMIFFISDCTCLSFCIMYVSFCMRVCLYLFSECMYIFLSACNFFSMYSCLITLQIYIYGNISKELPSVISSFVGNPVPNSQQSIHRYKVCIKMGLQILFKQFEILEILKIFPKISKDQTEKSREGANSVKVKCLWKEVLEQTIYISIVISFFKDLNISFRQIVLKQFYIILHVITLLSLHEIMKITQRICVFNVEFFSFFLQSLVV